MSSIKRELAQTLQSIERHDLNYDQRHGLVIDALSLAHQCGYEVGIGVDMDQPGWPVVYIELPTGQVSWHMQQHVRDYDGHSTEEKYARCNAYAEQIEATR
jgi:hypothetical protein